jgi:hypothetical protein
MHTSPFKKLRSVWQMEVKSSLTRTSSRPGGATSTSSIASGSPGHHATAAARNKHGQPLVRSWPTIEPVWCGIKSNEEEEEEEEEKRRRRKLAAGNATFAFDGLSPGGGVVRQAAVAVGRHGVLDGFLLGSLPCCSSLQREENKWC